MNKNYALGPNVAQENYFSKAKADLKTALREEDDLDNLVDGEMEVEEEERSRKESSKSNSSASSSDSNVSITCSAISIVAGTQAKVVSTTI